MSTVRDVVVGVAGSAAVVAFGRRTVGLVTAGAGTVDELVATTAALLGAALAAWYVLTSLALLAARTASVASRRSAAAALGRAANRWGAPLLRRTAAAAVGAGLVLGVPPAWAAVHDSPAATESIEGVPLDLRPGFGPVSEGEALEEASAPVRTEPATPPAEPATPPAARPAAQRAPAQAARPTYIVEPGDSLWSISAASLGAGATDAQVAAEWPRWYRTNRAVVGADPDLIHPGQELLAPGPKDNR